MDIVFVCVPPLIKFVVDILLHSFLFSCRLSTIATKKSVFRLSNPQSATINSNLYLFNDFYVETSSPAFTNSKYDRNLRSASGMKWK